jgi:hypothetical protein
MKTLGKTYCKVCGGALVIHEETVYFGRNLLDLVIKKPILDEYTGKPRTIKHLMCPKAKGINRDCHTKDFIYAND